jgi:hypothetical protein
MKESDSRLDQELRMGAQYTAKHFTPAPGAVPRVPGIDVYGIAIPFNGIAGGDLIIFRNASTWRRG